MALFKLDSWAAGFGRGDTIIICFPVVGSETVLLMVSHLKYFLVKIINNLFVFSKYIENISVVASQY